MGPAAVMHRWYDEVWNNNRPEAIAELFPAHGRAHGLGPEPVVGPEAFRALWDGFRAAFPGVHVDMEHEIEQGDMVFARCTAVQRRPPS
jgi:hypothetical protein